MITIEERQYKTLTTAKGHELVAAIAQFQDATPLFRPDIHYTKMEQPVPGYPAHKMDVLTDTNQILPHLAQYLPLQNCVPFFTSNNELLFSVSQQDIYKLLNVLIERAIQEIKDISDSLYSFKEAEELSKYEEKSREDIENAHSYLKAILLLAMEYQSTKKPIPEAEEQVKINFLQSMGHYFDIFYLHLSNGECSPEEGKSFGYYEAAFFEELITLQRAREVDDEAQLYDLSDENSSEGIASSVDPADPEDANRSWNVVGSAQFVTQAVSNALKNWWYGDDTTLFVGARDHERQKIELARKRQRRLMTHLFGDGQFGFSKFIACDPDQLFTRECVREALGQVIALNSNSEKAYLDIETLRYYLVVLAGYLKSIKPNEQYLLDDPVPLEDFEEGASNGGGVIEYFLSYAYPNQQQHTIRIEQEKLIRRLLNLIKMIYSHNLTDFAQELLDFANLALMGFVAKNYEDPAKIAVIKEFFDNPPQDKVANGNESPETLLKRQQEYQALLEALLGALSQSCDETTYTRVCAALDLQADHQSTAHSVRSKTQVRGVQPGGAIGLIFPQIIKNSPLQQIYLYLIVKHIENKTLLFSDYHERFRKAKVEEFKTILDLVSIGSWEQIRQMVRSLSHVSIKGITRRVESIWNPTLRAQLHNPVTRAQELDGYRDKRIGLSTMTDAQFGEEKANFIGFINSRIADGKAKNSTMLPEERSLLQAIKNQVTVVIDTTKVRGAAPRRGK